MASEDLIYSTQVVWMILMILLHHFWSLIASAPIYIHCMENTVAPQTYSGHDRTTHAAHSKLITYLIIIHYAW